MKILAICAAALAVSIDQGGPPDKNFVEASDQIPQEQLDEVESEKGPVDQIEEAEEDTRNPIDVPQDDDELQDTPVDH